MKTVKLLALVSVVAFGIALASQTMAGDAPANVPVPVPPSVSTAPVVVSTNLCPKCSGTTNCTCKAHKQGVKVKGTCPSACPMAPTAPVAK